MNEDPTYEYVKGVGWVPAQYPMASAVIAGYRVTVIQRKPEVGEYFFNERTGYTAQQTLDNLKSQGYRFEKPDNIDVPKYHANYQPWGNIGTFMTVILEKL